MADREEDPADVTDTGQSLLTLGDEMQANLHHATANRTEITAAATELVQSIKTIVDYLNLRPNVEYHREDSAERHNQTGWLTRLKGTVDTILEWLENSGRVPGSKLEQILRGLYNLTELGNHAHLFAIMELACEFLNTLDDPFPGQRQYIVQCNEDVRTQQERIVSLVEQARELLQEMVEEEEVDYLQGRRFDNIVREANDEIETCRRRVTRAKQAISELAQKMATVKWTSRAIRAAGWGFTSYFFIKRYQESSHSSTDLVKLGGGIAVSFWMWMSLFPGRASIYYESLPKLQADHQMLEEKLEDLRIGLKSAKDHRDGL